MTQGFTNPRNNAGLINAGTAGQLAYYSASGKILTGGLLGNINGTATNDNAGVGKDGEIIENTGSGVGLTSVTLASICTLSLTAGDWDVWGNLQFVPAGSTTVNIIVATINTSIAFPSPVTNGGAYTQITYPANVTGGQHAIPTGKTRMSLAGATTVYLLGYASFGTSTLAVNGYITARRAR